MGEGEEGAKEGRLTGIKGGETCLCRDREIFKRHLLKTRGTMALQKRFNGGGSYFHHAKFNLIHFRKVG